MAIDVQGQEPEGFTLEGRVRALEEKVAEIQADWGARLKKEREQNAVRVRRYRAKRKAEV